MSTDILPQPEYPQCPCANCRGRVAEGLALKARANLLMEALGHDFTSDSIRWHAHELVETMRRRGLA